MAHDDACQFDVYWLLLKSHDAGASLKVLMNKMFFLFNWSSCWFFSCFYINFKSLNLLSFVILFFCISSLFEFQNKMFLNRAIAALQVAMCYFSTMILECNSSYEKSEDTFDISLDLMQTKPSDAAFSAIFRTSINTDWKQLVTSFPAWLWGRLSLISVKFLDPTLKPFLRNSARSRWTP